VRGSRPLGYAGQLAVLGAVPLLLLTALAAVAAGAAACALPLGWWGFQLAHLWRVRAVLGLRASDLPWVPAVDLLAAAVWAGGLFGAPEPPRA
jgi:hypothetical protein